MLVPIIRPAEPKEMGVPEMVIPGPPLYKDVLAMAKPFTFGVNIWLPTEKTVGVGGCSAMVLVPMMSAEGPRDIGVPEIVRGGPPGVRLVPAIAKPLESTVRTWPPESPIVKTDG